MTIDTITVFACVASEHKVKIVRALQSKGHVVAMTGDGVNDAPALKAADIGIAMCITGTAVAKEAATMVSTDDNFATIVSAIHQGRVLYDNILKFVRFQLSTTIGAILTGIPAPLAGLPEPFTPLQILSGLRSSWMGPPAISLALDAARPGIMHGAAASTRRLRPAHLAHDQDLGVRNHDDGRHTCDAVLRDAEWLEGPSAHARFHNLRVVSVVQHFQRPSRKGKRLQFAFL